jgi:putative membrane protein
MMDYMGSYGWGTGFGYMFMLLFWVLIIIGIIALARWLMMTAGNTSRSSPKTARQILDERYARGEIDREKFVQKKRDLEQ